MSKLIFLCISLTIFLFSCKSESNNVYTNITALVDEAEVIINKYDNNVQSALDSKKYDYIKVVSRAAQDSSNVKINDIKNLILSPNAEELRISAITYIKSLQKIIDVQTSYATITNTTSRDAAKTLDTDFLEAVQYAKNTREVYVSKLNTYKTN